MILTLPLKNPRELDAAAVLAYRFMVVNDGEVCCCCWSLVGGYKFVAVAKNEGAPDELSLDDEDDDGDEDEGES